MCAPVLGKWECPHPWPLGSEQQLAIVKNTFVCQSLFFTGLGNHGGVEHNLSCPIPRCQIPEIREKRPPPQELSFPPCGCSQGLFFCFGSSGSILHVLGGKPGSWEAHWPHGSALHQLAILPTVQSGNGSNHLPLGSGVDRASEGPCSTWGREATCIESGPGQWTGALLRHHTQDAFHRDRYDP